MLVAFHWYPNLTESTSPLILFTRNSPGWVRYYQPIADWSTVTSSYEPVEKEKALQAFQDGTHSVSWDSTNGWKTGTTNHLFIEQSDVPLRRDFNNGHAVLTEQPTDPDTDHYYSAQPNMLLKSTDPSGIALKQSPNCSKYYWAHKDIFSRWHEQNFPITSRSCYATLHPDGTVKIVGDDEQFFKIEFQTPDTLPRPTEVTPVYIQGRFSTNNNDIGHGSCVNDPSCPCAKFASYTGEHCTTIYYSINYDPVNQTIRIDSPNRLDAWFEIDFNRGADPFRVQLHLFNKAAADKERERKAQVERERKEEERRQEEREQERKREQEERKRKQEQERATKRKRTRKSKRS